MPNPNRAKRYTLTFDPGNGCLSLQDMVYIFYDIASIASILSFGKYPFSRCNGGNVLNTVFI